MRTRKTTAIGQLGEELISRKDPKGRRFSARAVLFWPEVAGEDVIKHTHGSSLRDGGELVIYVDSAAWANELSLMADRYKHAINEKAGKDLVSSIRFTVSKKAKPDAWEAQGPTDEEPTQSARPTSADLSESERRQAEYMASAVPNEELRETALRVMIRDLEWKKAQDAPNSAQTPTGGSRGGKKDAPPY